MDYDVTDEEIDEKLMPDFVTTTIISHDSMVTCGECKLQMTFEEYDYKHRKIHYNLCWLDGVEDEINFSDLPKIHAILRKSINKSKIKLKCYLCNEIKLSIVGFTNHLNKCKNEPELNTIIDTVLEQTQNDDNLMVSCGRCGENMSHAEYKNEHRHKHYNLCWLEGEEKLDYTNEKKLVTLLREILPKYAERDKKLNFICEWCENSYKSVVGYVVHVKKCAIEQKKSILCPDEAMVEKINLNHNSNFLVICGCCNKSMSNMEYEEKHKPIHNNLCWIKGDEKVDFDDENVTINLLRQFSRKYAAQNKKVKLTCEWCQITKKSIPGFASHVKQCQLRPDRKANSTVKLDIEVSNERDDSMVTCGRCKKEMTFKEYRIKHCSTHYNLCWIVGEEKPNLENFVDVCNILKKFVPFKDIRNRTVKLTCEDCKSVKKSLAGFASHIIFCNKTANDIHLLLIRCEDCGKKIKPSSYISHKLKSCKANTSMNNGDDFIKDQSYNGVSESLSCKSRRKRRPPNVLSFHPDTKYVTEHYDYMCRLCNFITTSVDDIITHVINFHNIDINNIDDTNNLDGYILNTYDVQRNIYLKPFLNYYNFYKKTFWTATFHEDFQSDILRLNTDEALKYLPSIQQSCKIFSSDDEEICVDLFKSIYINDMFWLFTGGPNWAMSWCPVPEQIQTQYLAISCHPKPDLVHKEMDIYKYPSLVQLWTFDLLSNIDYKSCSDMPYMSYGLAHEFGAVWDMAWCPSGAYEPNKKIGLLALSTSCGDCPVFAMPHIVGDTETFFVYKLKPVIARNFECEWVESGVQCTKVCWQAVPPFNTLICGYSNGMVSIFNINFKSIFLNGDILYPSRTFRASRSSITGLSLNHFNSSILATAATDGYIILWDLKSTENPIFQKKTYSVSDCTWIQQCHTLVYCSKCVNPLFLKVRTINFSNCDDDVCDYNPTLYVMKNMSNSSKVISNYNVVKNDEKLNCDFKSFDDSDETIEHKSNTNNKNTTHNNSNTNSDNESSRSNDKKSSAESGDESKNIEEEDYYGPTFVQKSTHWSVSGSNWMNVIATGDANGVIYEKLFLPETNQMRKGNSTTLQVMVKKMLNETSQSEFSNGCNFQDTVQEFGLESTFFPCEMTNLRSDPDDSKPLLRYPLENITEVSWNQNLSSFRWLGIGTQSGFAIVSPSQAIPDNCFESFYEITTNGVGFDNVKCKTESDNNSM